MSMTPPWFANLGLPVTLAVGCLLAALCSLASPPPASAQSADTVNYTVTVDCSHGAIRREGTAATYEIIGLSERGEEVPFTADSVDMNRLTESDCRRGVEPFTTREPLPDTVHIRRFRIALVGSRRVSDALYLDSLQVSLGGPTVADSIAWDGDGGSGWCLSQDPADGRGSWRHYLFDDTCSPCLEFSVVPKVAGDSIVDGEWRDTAAPGYAECSAESSEGGG